MRKFAIALSCLAVLSGPVFAQSLPLDGTVVKIDEGAGKITLRHGPIKKLGMDEGMTMVFKVKDAAMLDKVQVGSKVRFKAEKSDGAIVVTSVELAQ